MSEIVPLSGVSIVYVAPATGQNVANLPAIFHERRKGDVVIWLESAGEKAIGHAARLSNFLSVNRA